MEAFCGSILFFIAGHELALVSECGKKKKTALPACNVVEMALWLGDGGGEMGCLHGVVGCCLWDGL